MRTLAAMLILSLLAVATPTNAQDNCSYAGGGHFESTETGPRNLLIWDDFQKAPRTSPRGSSGTFQLTYSVPCANDYIFELPDSIGSKSNAVKGIFETLIIAEDGRGLGDLTRGPTQAIHFDANTPRTFDVAWKIANITDEQYQEYRAIMQENAQKNGRNSLDDEMLVQLSIVPAQGPEQCQADGQSCAAVQTIINLAMRYKVPPGSLAFSCTPTPTLQLSGELQQSVLGPTCTSNTALQFHVKLTGDLAKAFVQVSSLEEALFTPDGVTSMPFVIGGEGATEAEADIILPAGTHTLNFTIMGRAADGHMEFTNSLASFSVGFEGPGGGFVDTLENVGHTVGQPFVWIPLVVAIGAGGLFAVGSKTATGKSLIASSKALFGKLQRRSAEDAPQVTPKGSRRRF